MESVLKWRNVKHFLYKENHQHLSSIIHDFCPFRSSLGFEKSWFFGHYFYSISTSLGRRDNGSNETQNLGDFYNHLEVNAEEASFM